LLPITDNAKSPDLGSSTERETQTFGASRYFVTASDVCFNAELLRGAAMDEVVSKVTPEQALKIVERLSQKGGKIRQAVVAEAISILTEIDLDETADEVFVALDSIDVQDCWDRSGGSRDGYTSPDEAAAQIIDEELQPFLGQVERYNELGMFEQEAACCAGVILGIYRYERESKSEFRAWSADVSSECAGLLLDNWQKRTREGARINAMHNFVRERCPEWARWLKGTKEV
jgi:hypothetical protein